MLEALACGKAIVSTPVSGTGTMVHPGENGFIVTDRDPARFAAAMNNALHLPQAEQVSLSIARRYSLSGLGRELERLWPPLAPAAGPNEVALCPQ
jgi:glycosyltransferase involved in cell wall biosynthesis